MAATTHLGLDGETYLVFDDPHQAYKLSNLLDIGVYCFNGFENALKLADFLPKALNTLATIEPTAEALALSNSLIELTGQRCETPPS